jgi:hypothetical protein
MDFWEFLDRFLDKKIYFKSYKITIEEDDMDDFKEYVREKRRQGKIVFASIKEINEKNRNQIKKRV